MISICRLLCLVVLTIAVPAAWAADVPADSATAASAAAPQHMTIGLRVSEEEKREGLDISLHGESVE